MKVLFLILIPVIIICIGSVLFFRKQFIINKKIKLMQSHGYRLEESISDDNKSLKLKVFVKDGYKSIGYYNIMHVDYDFLEEYLDTMVNPIDESIDEEEN